MAWGVETAMGRAIEAFQAAGVGEGGWDAALARLAAVTGSRSGQLIGLGADAAVPFNWITETPPDTAERFVEVGGGDPRVNSRVRVGAAAPELAVRDERHFTTAEDMRRHRAYGELLHDLDSPFVCLTNLLRRDGMLVGLSVIRGAAQGPISDEQRRIFAALAPHVRGAVRAQMALAREGAALVAGALEGLNLAAFVCDGDGQVRGLTGPAEALLRQTSALALRHGRLAAACEEATASLDLAIRATAAGGLAAPPADILLRAADGCALTAQVTPIPAGRHAFGQRAAAVVVVRRPQEAVEARAARTAAILFALTPAEARIAGALAAGRRPAAVAQSLGISVGTVRTHVRHIFEKAGVNSQLQLVALINARL